MTGIARQCRRLGRFIAAAGKGFKAGELRRVHRSKSGGARIICRAAKFTGLIDQFAAADTVVLGVSKDSCEKHQKFINKHGLKVELLADTDGELCELYGTWGERKFMGRTYMGIGRSTFVIDKQGKLAHVDYKVKAKGHAQAMLELVQGLG